MVPTFFLLQTSRLEEVELFCSSAFTWNQFVTNLQKQGLCLKVDASPVSFITYDALEKHFIANYTSASSSLKQFFL